jgi:exopolysaccharide biosynthesis protein
VREGLIRTEVDISGPAMHYRVFALDEPTRLVVDLTPHEPLPAAPTVSAPPAPAAPLPASEAAEVTLDATDALRLEPTDPSPPSAGRVLHPGVVHRELRLPVPGGTSRVDILEIDPAHGEFRVVGESFVPRTLLQLSDGGLAAINASYFDTRNHLSIGFLRIDHTLLSLPSRNRASIGFGVGRPIIDRVAVDLSVRVNGRPAFQGIVTENQVVVHTSAGYLVGSPTRGALVVEQGRVVENKIGPRRVPEGGFVLVYEPDIRELALADEGDLLSYSARFVPDAFNRVRYAVEAGPLLVQDGRPAYAPDLEAFDITHPESNVNRRTTRAAVAVREDGTVLFVTATNMTASELVPLFLSLGAVDAMQMDSGGSSTLVAKGEVINRPASSQRQIATAIVFVPHR